MSVWIVSVWIGLFWTFPVGGVTPCIVCLLFSLSVMFSGSIHMVASVRDSLLFRAE